MTVMNPVSSFNDNDAIKFSKAFFQMLSASSNSSSAPENSKHSHHPKYPSISELFAGYSGDIKVEEIQAVGIVGREMI